MRRARALPREVHPAMSARCRRRVRAEGGCGLRYQRAMATKAGGFRWTALSDRDPAGAGGRGVADTACPPNRWNMPRPPRAGMAPGPGARRHDHCTRVCEDASVEGHGFAGPHGGTALTSALASLDIPSGEDAATEVAKAQAEEEGQEADRHRVDRVQVHVRALGQGGAQAFADVDESVDQNDGLEPVEASGLGWW